MRLRGVAQWQVGSIIQKKKRCKARAKRDTLSFPWWNPSICGRGHKECITCVAFPVHLFLREKRALSCTPLGSALRLGAVINEAFCSCCKRVSLLSVPLPAFLFERVRYFELVGYTCASTRCSALQLSTVACSLASRFRISI